jgi:hypothetical protein
MTTPASSQRRTDFEMGVEVVLAFIELEILDKTKNVTN